MGDEQQVEQTFTAGEVAARLGVHEKSVRRWIEAGLIEASHAPGKGYELTAAQAETLRTHAAKVLQRRRRRDASPAETPSAADAGDLANMLARLASVERRLRLLEARQPSASPLPPLRMRDAQGYGASVGAMPLPTQRPESHRSAFIVQHTAPDGGDRVSLRRFADDHGVPSASASHHARDNAFPVVSEPRPGRPDQQMHYLDGPDTQRAALRYWLVSWRGDAGHTLRECASPSCVCHALLGGAGATAGEAGDHA